MLLAAGADPNVREAAYGNTPLMLAALRCATCPHASGSTDITV
jgi:ankyrin repeat protein